MQAHDWTTSARQDGEDLVIYDRRNGNAWIQAAADGIADLEEAR